jgi:integrase/recombinase XerD
MSGSLFDRSGQRKYLVASERRAFVLSALRRGKPEAAFCLALAISGARISEILALTPERIDRGNGALVIETLKRRSRYIYRAVPAPDRLLALLDSLPLTNGARIWPWCRTTAWSLVKSVMNEAKIASALCKPRALRHAFAVEAGQNGVPLNVIQRWLGHARLETTAIYLDALGQEERGMACKAWQSIEIVLSAYE